MKCVLVIGQNYVACCWACLAITIYKCVTVDCPMSDSSLTLTFNGPISQQNSVDY